MNKIESMKVAIVGSGNWGSAVARKVAQNIQSNNAILDKEVKMWVFEEQVNGRNLTEIINQDHENVKYLPGVKLPHTVLAVADIIETCRDADVLMFVVPHQFLPGVLGKLKGNVKGSAIGVSLIKGIQFTPDGPELFSNMIKNELNLEHTAVVMGANVANEVAMDTYVETTVASKNILVAELVASLFHSPQFRTEVSTDVSAVELCGALKNVVAIGAGIFCLIGCFKSKLQYTCKKNLCLYANKVLSLQTFLCFKKFFCNV